MTDTVNPKNDPFGNAIKDGEVVFVNKNGRRERGTLRTCKECTGTFVIATSSIPSSPNRGTFCGGACRNRATNRARKERGGYARKS